jgi:uncharacterized protein
VKIRAHVEALESLAVLDKELAALEAEIGETRESLTGKRDQLRSLEDQLGRHRGSVTQMEATRSDLFGEVRQMVVQVERSREKMARCRTEREANAVQRELEELRKLQRDREIEISKLDAYVEQAKSDIAAASERSDGITTDLSDTEGALSQNMVTSETRLGEVRTERAKITEALEPRLYRRYEMIRKRRGSAIAHTTDGTCSACHMHLPPMLFHTLARGADFDQCPSCNRIIYFRRQVEVEVPDPGSDAES